MLENLPPGFQDQFSYGMIAFVSHGYLREFTSAYMVYRRVCKKNQIDSGAGQILFAVESQEACPL